MKPVNGEIKLFGKDLENALIKARIDGWERGKEQVKTPYDFTLADDTYIENIWKELMGKLSKLIPQRDRIEKIVEDIFVSRKWITRLDKNAVTGEVDIMEAMDEIVNGVCKGDDDV